MAAGIELYNDVLNQKGSPALYSDIFANRPAFGYTGRLFISTDTNEIYRDTGTSWVLISSGGGGTNIYNSDGTLTGTRTLTNGGFDLIFTGATNAFNLDLDANANLARNISYTTATVDRFKLRVKDNETGSNAGSNFYISVYDDAGTYVLDCLTITRKTGEFYVYTQNDNVTPGTGSINGIFNSTRGTYQLANYTSGSPQSSIYNLFTYDPRTSITYANAQFMGVVGSVMRYEPTDSQTITMTQGSAGIRTQGTALSQIQFSVPATKTLTVSHVSLLNLLGFYNYTGTTGTFAVTNAYGIVINDLNEYSATGLSLTNRWGIYQAGANDINYFNANTLFGTTTNAGYKVDVSGTARVTQSAYFATASGNVGIGTASPSTTYISTINGFSSTVTGTVYRSSGTDVFYFGHISTTNTVDWEAWNPRNGYLRFATNANERMRIFANGNVRIASSFTDSGQLLQLGGNMDIINGGYIRDSIFSTSRITFANTVSVSANSGVNIETNGGSICAYFTSSYNFGLRQSTFGTSATHTLAISTGTAPGSSPADCFQLYSADITAGNAAAHFRTENGAIVKVYQETTAVGSATISSPGGGVNLKDDDTFDGYTIAQVVKALRNQGLLT